MKFGKLFVLFLLIDFFVKGCKSDPGPIMMDQEVANKWADMTLYILKNTPANSPTFASRTLGYIGLTMYESIVNGFPEYQSVANQLNGLNRLPGTEPTQSYVWPLALNAAQASILKNIYVQTSDSNKWRIDSLELAILKNYKSRNEKSAINRSIAYGKSIADSIFSWSKTDGGHRGYLHNFDKELKHPVFPGSWRPPLYAQSFSHNPLHPHWGENRTFLKQNAQMDTPNMIRYDTLNTSAYYHQYRAVYDKEKTLTQEEKEIALWWGDDPDVSITPPGHSYYIALRALRASHANMVTCAMTYARVGMAVADAFINCWKWKYLFFSERPNTFVPEHIDNSWESFWPDPPFPAFPSGHAIQSSAASVTLIDILGNNIAISDSTNSLRKRDLLRNTDFKTRHFDSLSQVPIEVANSRFYGGIHTPQDNNVGLEEGRKIGSHVNQLNWKKK
ncbi:MAG: vanadium-dependent haloperoxidase [Saprospiraceae bacterium]